MFFILAKIAWFLLQPLVLVLALVALGGGAAFAGFWRTGGALIAGGWLLLAVFALSPLGLLMMSVLENRFPVPALPEHVDGIVVLGGALDTRVAATRGGVELNDGADRMTATMALARRFPGAKVLFTGGVAALFEDDVPEADSAKAFFLSLGLEPSRLLLENRARDTAENARLAKALADPKPGETWLLVTSAYHMPRAVGCFRVAGFAVLPYPVDFRTPTADAIWRPSSTSTRNMDKVHDAVREFVGLVAYRLSGRTDSVLPGPASAGAGPSL